MKIVKNNLDEGLFSADRNKIRVTGDTKEELQAKIENYNKKFADYAPKVSNVKTDRTGRFFVDYSYQVNDKSNTETLAGKLNRGISKTKEVLNKGKEVVGKVVDKLPLQTTLTAPTGFKLGQEQAKYVKEHPDATFGEKFKNDKGEWAVKVVSSKAKAKSYNNPEVATSEDRINNIQRTLTKLSDSKLQKIEDIIKTKE